MIVQYDGKRYAIYRSQLGDVLVSFEEYELRVPKKSAAWLLQLMHQDARHVAHVMDVLEAQADPAVAWVWTIDYDGELCPVHRC